MDIIKKHNINEAVVLSIDFAKAFDTLSHEYIVDFLTHLGFPKSLINFQKIRFKNTKGSLKDYPTDDMFFSITRGVPQGSALSGYLFILCLTPLFYQIEMCKNIKPIEVDLKYLYLDRKLAFPKTVAFADDLNILMTLSQQNNEVLEIETLKEIFKQFEEMTTLSVNLEKTLAFTSINNQILDLVQEKYKIKNETNNVIRLLGHIFKPSDHLNSKHILEKIHQKINLSIMGLKEVELQGRYILTNTFLSSQLNYHITQLNKLFIKDTIIMQKLINNFIKAPYSNNSKYKPISKGGAQVPNIFNIIQAGKIASFKSYLHSKFN